MSASDTARLSDPRWLQGHWRLNGNAKDVSGHGNHGTWTAWPAYRITPNGRQAGDFVSASTANVTVPSSTRYNFGTGDFTIAQWVIFDAAGLMTSLSRQAWNAGWQMGKDAAGSQYQIHIAGTAVGPATTLTNGIPYHLVSARASGVVTMYCNGIYSTSAANAGNVDGAYPLYIGTQTGATNPTDGALWGIRIYSIALTGAEVRALYLSELGGSLL